MVFGHESFMLKLAGQPGVARAFALRAELCSSFLASRSLNPEMNCSSMRKIAFLWNVLALQAGAYLFFLHAFFQLSFQCQIAAPYCFRVLQLSVLIFVGEEKERVWLDIGYVSGLLSVSTPPSKGAVIRPKQMLFPRQFTERKARRLWNTLSCYSPLWLLRVTGNCFWFLDLPPVWKGLVCSPSLHLICSSFSFSSCGGFLFSFCSSGGPFSSLAACTDSLRYDRYAWTVGFRNFLPDRPSNYRQTDPRIESLRKKFDITLLHKENQTLPLKGHT